MTKERFQKLLTHGGAVNLSDRSKWTLSGRDRVRYLNGQVTNDVRKASETEAVYACVTNLKGRIEGDLFVHSLGSSEGSLVADAEAGLREPLGMRLERYIIADDVELEDITPGWALWHYFGRTRLDLAQLSLPEGARQISATRFGSPGWDLWWPANPACALPAFPDDVPVLTPEEMETWRILAGVPRWPHELHGEVFPPEAGLQSRAMDYAKGCYIGQEVLSRIKTTGKMPNSLVKVRAREVGPVLKAGGALLKSTEDGSPVKAGHITSVSFDPLADRETGLAYVKQSFAIEHSLLLAAGDLPNITFEVEIILP